MMIGRPSILRASLTLGLFLLACDNTTVDRPLFGSGAGGVPASTGGAAVPTGGSITDTGGIVVATGGLNATGGSSGGVAFDASPAATGGVIGNDGSANGGADGGGQTPVPGQTAASIALGSNHTCALADDGTVKCWGSNFSGQIGDGTSTPAYFAPIAVPGLASVTQIALGGGHSCALLADHTVKCWGGNATGQLGYATTTKCSDLGSTAAVIDCSRTPTAVPGLTGVKQIAVAGEETTLELWGHSCALLTDGSVKCWGANDYGQLGDGTITSRSTPTLVPGLTGVLQIAVGKYYSCALLQAGTVKCWGSPTEGDVGGSAGSLPALVDGLAGVTSIAVGGFQICAVLADTTMKCWGSNGYGELGDGTTIDRLVPTPVLGVTGIVSVSLGNEHSCVLLKDGSVRCCGRNDSGQIGDGTNATPTSFIPIPGLSGVVQIALGNDHSGARGADGSVKCWGSNSSGGLGDGTKVSRNTPTSVVGFGAPLPGDGGAGGAGGSDAGFDGSKGGAGADGSAAGGAGGFDARGDVNLGGSTAGAGGREAGAGGAAGTDGSAVGGTAGADAAADKNLGGSMAGAGGSDVGADAAGGAGGSTAAVDADKGDADSGISPADSSQSEVAGDLVVCNGFKKSEGLGQDRAVADLACFEPGPYLVDLGQRIGLNHGLHLARGDQFQGLDQIALFVLTGPT